MNPSAAKKTLTHEQLVKCLTAQWNEIKAKEAVLEDMQGFLKNFVATVKAQFGKNISIQTIQDLFIVSDSQACLQCDVINNEVEFKTREGRKLHLPGDTNFNKICCKFFEFISKEKHWRDYKVLKEMFDQTQRNNPSIDCLGIALKDVLRRLMKINVIEAKYFKAKSKKTLTREQLIQLLSAQWSKTKTKEAALDDMKNFLQNFETTVKEQFDTDAPIHKMQNLFMVSDSQACLEGDVKSNEVEFKTKNGRTFDLPKESNFDKICYQFFELISTKQHWRGYSVLKDMLYKTQRINPNINCPGITLTDVLRRLMKINAIEARYFRANSKLNTHETVSTLAIQLIAYIGILAAGLPENREALKVVYCKFVENIQNKPPGLESVTFDLVVQHLKSIKIIKVLPGAADIVYLKETSLVIYEYFGNDTHMNESMTGSRVDLRNGSRNELRTGSKIDLRTGSGNGLRTGSKIDFRTGSRNDLRAGSKIDLRTGSGNGLRTGSKIDFRTGSRNDLRADNSIKQGHAINKEKMRKLAKDTHGISIASDLDDEESREFGIINIGSHMQGERAMAKLTILFTACDGGEQLITLTGCKLLDNSNDVFTIGDKYNIQQGKEVLPISAGSSYQITVYYRSKHVGKHKCPLEIQFNPRNGKQPFSIFRFIEGETKNSEIDELQSNEPYQPKKKRQVAEDEGMYIEDGVPPNGPNAPLEVYLGNYSIPSDIRYNVKKGGSKVSGAVKKIIKNTSLEPDAYVEKFHTLLYLEELQMETNIRDFDMEHAELVKAGKLLGLEIPGLAEGKPSLIVGDQAYVQVESGGGQQQTKHDRKEYQGYIHVVERDRILLKFSPSFHKNFVKGQRHRVRFSFNRGTIRLQHRAIDMACELIYKRKFPSVLDPQESHTTPLLTEREVNRISCYNRLIEGNAEQLTAVKNIVAGSSGSCPYIIFGPPGTGKTVTCVEAMKQVLKLSKNSRILACTPSNSAADLILQRLIKPCPIPCSKIFRLNAFSRALNSLPDDFNIKDFCKIENDSFEMPTSEEIEDYRVVICTMAAAGKLVNMGVPADHFTHIFLDECGQAVEPEALIPLAGLIDPDNKFGGQVVLAGDPKQLGPVLQSPIAIRYGLEMSLLERIMKTGDVFQRKIDGAEEESISRESGTCQLQSTDNDFADIGRYDNRYITKLVMNYRTHPDILRQPNKLFYSNELIPSADDFKVTSLCKWSELPTKDFPIIFHGVEGEDSREGSSPSFFNRYEAVEVVKYVRALLDHKSLGVTPDEIGIISPYKKQVSKIRQLLMKERNRKRIEEMKVGSVEEFQGQERRIIIISTVRSNREYLKMDSKFCLGFLKNPKRFNVAITRAQALLIIVGNPFVLAEDHCWKVLLDYCIERGGYKGCKYDDDVVNDLSTKVSDIMKAL